MIYPQDINEWLRSQIPPSSLENATQIKFDGVQENVSGELVNIPVVYGYRRVTGPRVFTAVKSNNSTVLYTAIAVSEGPITKFHKLFINDEQISLNGVLTAEQLNGGDHRVTTGTYANILNIGLHRGERTANSLTGTLAGPTSPILTRWTGNSQDIRAFTESMAGIAYVVLEMVWYANSPYKDFPKITVEISGRKLRNASTSGFGNESNVFQDANPADVLLDYMTNSVYGQGMADSRIDATTISSLRSSMDTTVIPYTNGTAQSRLSCNVVVDTGNTVLENINDLCRQFNIVLTLANGVYRFTPEYKSTTYVLTVDKTNLIGEYQITYPDLSVKYNRVSVNFASSINSFTDSIETIEDSTAIVTDGKVFDITVDCPAITDPYMALRTAETILRKSRGQKIYAFTMTREALRLTVGDIVIWDPENSGTSTDYLRVIEMSMNNEMLFEIKAVTHDDTFYPPFTLANKRPKQIEILPTPGGIQPVIIDPVPPVVTTDPAPVPIIQPPPPRPTVATKRKVTVAGPTALVDTLPNGDNFYPVPIRKFQNQDTSVDDANYKLDDSYSFSTFSLANNYGNYVGITKETISGYDDIFYDYRPALFYRERDLDNRDLGGEGIIIGNGGIAYNRIHYVYEIEYNKFGWFNVAPLLRNQYEKIFFDPEAGTDKNSLRRVTPSTSRSGELVSLLETYRGNVGPSIAFDANSKSYFGCPFLEYNGNSYVTPPIPLGYLGLRYYLKYVAALYGKPWAIPDLTGGTPPLSKDIWQNKQNIGSASNTAQLMTIKYFLINTRNGDYQYLTKYTINLDDARPGDQGIKTTIRNLSFTNYREAFGTSVTPPFTKV